MKAIARPLVLVVSLFPLAIGAVTLAGSLYLHGLALVYCLGVLLVGIASLCLTVCLFRRLHRHNGRQAAWLDSVIAGANVGLFLFDAKLNFISSPLLPAGFEAFPGPLSSGKSLAELFGQEFSAPFEAAFGQAIHDGRRRTIRYPLDLPGRRHYFEAKVNFSNQPEAGMPQLTLVVRDISASVRFERMQAYNIKWFKTMFNKLSEAVVLSDATGTIRGLNQRTIELYGFKKNELLDQPLDKLFSERPETISDVLVLDEENPVRVSEHWHAHCDGTRFPVEIRSSPLRIDNQKFTLSLIRDISFQKELEEQQRHYEQGLLNQSAMRDKLFSILAHDLRGPIGNLRSFLSAYQNNHKLFSPQEFDEFMDGLRVSTDATWGLLENLLSWVRNQFSDISINHSPVGLLETCRLVVSWLRPQALAKRQEIVVSPLVDHVILSDANMLQTVIRNLLGNAIKFSPIGGRITLRVVSGDAVAGVVLEDNGPGVPNARLHDLFTLRGGASLPGSSGEKGSGLGLVLSQEIVGRLGGRIEVENTYPGASFTVWLPAGVEGDLDAVEDPPRESS